MTKLLNCAASKSAIITWLDDAATSTGTVNPTNSDDVIVFVSGHGTRVFDSNCAGGAGDGDRERIDNGILVNTGAGTDVICDGELRSKMDAITAARKVVILDISFPSGFNRDFSTASNTLFIAAARGEARELAYPSTHPCFPGAGVFTCHFVVRGIIGGEADDSTLNPHANDDGLVSLEDAYDFTVHVLQGPLTQKPSCWPGPGSTVKTTGSYAWRRSPPLCKYVKMVTTGNEDCFGKVVVRLPNVNQRGATGSG